MHLPQNIQKALQDPALYQFLQWKYPQTPLLMRGDQRYPVVVYSAPKMQQNNPESVLSGLDLQQTSQKKLIIQDSSYRTAFKMMNRPLIDLPTYTMSEFHSNGFLKFQCGLGSYFHMLDTCEALEWELLVTWCNHFGCKETSGSQDKNFLRFEAQLPLRQKVHSCVSDPIHSGKGRSVGLAVSTLIAFYDHTTLHLWLQRRSSQTISLHEGMFHVFPSFMLQPTKPHGIKEEFSITYHFHREYMEELFNRPHFSALGDPPFHFYQDPCFLRLQRYQEQKEALFLFTGVAVNLLNLRPEICTLLFIKNPEWFAYHFRQAPSQQKFCCNEEFLEAKNQHSEKILPFGFQIPYTDLDDDLIKTGNLYPDKMVPSGAAAFWLGIDTLRSRL